MEKNGVERNRLPLCDKINLAIKLVFDGRKTTFGPRLNKMSLQLGAQSKKRQNVRIEQVIIILTRIASLSLSLSL